MSTAQERNYDSISPSAKALLLLKGLTDIPYAKEAATLISLPEKYEPDLTSKDFTTWARVLHFEHRYKTIDNLLQDLTAKNILELSSGFSFRGLKVVQDNDIYYIDTDLPELINTKKKFIDDLQDKNHTPKGKLEILPLNALDEEAFTSIADRFPQGELTIVNEGLLMYLGIEEKKKLCAIIRKVLQKRGGCWITADIYVRFALDQMPRSNDKLQKFFEEHNIEANKFESFEIAETFFKEQGFIVEKEAVPQYGTASSLQYMMASLSDEQKSKAGNTPKMQTTWRLRLA